MTQINEKSKFSRKIQRALSDVINIKEESKENSKETPAADLKKRKSLNYGDKKLSTTSTVSLTSSASIENDENSSDNSATSAKKLKKIRDITKKDKDQSDKEENETDDKPTTSKSNAQSKKAKKSAHKNDEANDSDEDDYEPNTKKAKKSGKAKKEIETKNEEKSEESVKTVKFAGEVPLDEKFTTAVGTDYKVYREGKLIYDCMLNQTNLQYNNNKYYVIQLIEKIKSKEYLVWTRWGRVGKSGQFSVENFGDDLNGAKEMFAKKFFDKTKNEWDDKDNFEKQPGKYDLVETDYDDPNKSEEKELDTVVKKEKETKKDIPPSKLDKKLQDLLELICNISEMENVLKEMKYDAKKSPLGKLSKTQIKAGYAALKEIEDLIKNKASNDKLVEASNDFYTRIPHDFGMKVPPLIKTAAQLREKMKLLEILDEVEIAFKILNQESEIENPIDRHYNQLNCILKPIDHSDKMFKIIEEYAIKTHAPTHNNYKLKIIDVFEAEKPGEKEKFKDHGNRMLLWHGSRTTNWAGILSEGLRIAPPEAPVTGYMFGKGCYFADCSSKSANYCYTSSSKNIGFLSLSEVSLGQWNELRHADYDADKLPKGKMSTKGVGKSEPNKKEWITLDDGCVVPCGKLISSKDTTPFSLLYNEYIVYDVDQIKLRYLVKVEFEYDY